MRFLDLELEESRPLSRVAPPVREPSALASPADGILFVLDRPDGATPRLLRFGPGDAWRAIDLPGFTPRMIADSPDGELLAVGVGAHGNGLLLDLDGRALRRCRYGDAIADLGYDLEGNLLVLRTEGRPDRPLLSRFGPDGDLVRDDPAVEDMLEATTQTAGSMLLVQNDGAVWLNLAEKFDANGRLLLSIDPAARFGAGRVSADVFGPSAALVLSESGRLTALLEGGAFRDVAVPEAARSALGRAPTAARDLLCTRGDRLHLLATDLGILLRLRILWE